jgi:hypothetical protein
MVGFETKLLFGIAYHPQTDGQIERVNKIVEDMIRMHVMHQPKKWEDYLPLVEFSYNNGYQESLRMSPFEALYGRHCKIPVSWSNPVEKITIGPNMLKEMEQKVIQIKQILKIAQDRQKHYADRKITPREFKAGDHVYLRVRPRKSSLRMGACAKFSPRYCGPFEILDRVGPIAYRLASPPTIKAHNVFHASLLKKYVHDANHIIDWFADALVHYPQFTNDVDLIGLEDQRLWFIQVGRVILRLQRLSSLIKSMHMLGPHNYCEPSIGGHLGIGWIMTTRT